MLNIGYVHLMTAAVIGLFILLIYLIYRFARSYFLAFVFLGFSMVVTYLTMMYLPYYGVVPAGTVVIPTNFTTVSNGTTTIYTGVSLTRTIYTVAGEAKYMPYLGVMVALISGIIGFLLLIMAAMRGIIHSAYRGWRRR